MLSAGDVVRKRYPQVSSTRRTLVHIILDVTTRSLDRSSRSNSGAVATTWSAFGLIPMNHRDFLEMACTIANVRHIDSTCFMV